MELATCTSVSFQVSSGALGYRDEVQPQPRDATAATILPAEKRLTDSKPNRFISIFPCLTTLTDQHKTEDVPSLTTIAKQIEKVSHIVSRARDPCSALDKAADETTNTTMPNGTQYHTWKPEPLVRGTFSILSSSLLTMILCVWTAVHLNVPAHEADEVKAKTWRIPPQTRRKLSWMLVAIFTPEWVSLIALRHGWPTLISSKVLFTAYCEHVAANDIGKAMRRAFGQPEPPGLAKRLEILKPRNLLRLVVRLWKRLSHFICLVFFGTCHSLSIISTRTYNRCVSEQAAQQIDAEAGLKSERHLWTRTHSLYSTMGGFAVDTRDLGLNYLPNGGQRMTLTRQGLKFIAEKAPNLLPDLPESVIVDKSKANAFTKLVACGQAVWFCAQCATRSAQGLSISLLEINTAVHATCTLIMYFQFWWHKPLDVEEPTILTNADTHSVTAFLAISQQYPRVIWSPVDIEDDEHIDSAPNSEDVITHPRLKHVMLKQSKDPQFPSTDYVVYRGFAIPFKTTYSKLYRNLTDIDFQRFELASGAARKYGLRIPRARPGHRPIQNSHLVNRSSNGPMVLTSKAGFGFPLASLFYGSIHLLVWNRPFRSETDEMLWKVSSLTILASGIPFALGVWWVVLSDDSIRQRRCQRDLWKLISWLSFVCFALFYASCRAFIIVESFLDVFHLPDSAFEVPQWSQYFPHG